MNAFSLALGAVVPFVSYLVLGQVFVRLKWTNQTFLKQLNQFVFKALFPILMFVNVTSLPLDGRGFLKLFFGLCLGLVGLVLLSALCLKPLALSPGQKAVIVQALYRSNMVLFALPLAGAVLDPSGLALVTGIVALLVPFLNVLAVIILEAYQGKRRSLVSLLGEILKNPLIMGAMAGFVWNLTGLTMPQVLMEPLKALAGATSPLALLVLGGSLQVQSLRKHAKIILLTLTTKMVLLPALAIWLAQALGLDGNATFICFMVFATPIAVSSYSMAENMGADGPLAGELVSLSTLTALVTLFGWIYWMKASGIL